MTQAIKCLPVKHEELGWIFPEPTEEDMCCTPVILVLEREPGDVGPYCSGRQANQQALELMPVLISKNKVGISAKKIAGIVLQVPCLPAGFSIYVHKWL